MNATTTAYAAQTARIAALAKAYREAAATAETYAEKRELLALAAHNEREAALRDLPTVATLDQPTEYVDRTLQTASWWDRYELLPGSYAVEYVDTQYRPIGRPYYAVVKVKAILKESYRVNRLFTASSSELTFPEQETTHSFVLYAYQLQDQDDFHAYGLRFHR